MWLLIPVLLLAVVYLAQASETAAPPTGTPNGVVIDGTGQITASPGPDRALPYLGTTGQPTPFTGLGRPGASKQTQQIYYLLGDPGARRNGSAFNHPRRMGGTGLLDPLPDRGSQSKRLLTQDVLTSGGTKV